MVTPPALTEMWTDDDLHDINVHPAVRRRLHQPNTWSATLLVLLVVILIWHDSIAASIYGTERRRPVAISVVPLPAGDPIGFAEPRTTAPPQRRHKPVDPFAPVVDGSGVVQARTVLARLGSTSGAAAVTASAPKPSRASTTPAGCAASYVVRPGDSLWSIATTTLPARERAALSWQALYAANRAVVGSDPTVLAVGARLCVPAAKLS